MKKIAIVEDSTETNNALAGFCRSISKDIVVDQFHDRESAEKAIIEGGYSLIVLDIELPPEKNAGVGILRTNIENHKTPVMVVSGLDPSLYRGVMRQLDVWDYMEKPIPPDGQEFIEMVWQVLRSNSAPDAEDKEAIITYEQATGKMRFKGKPLNIPQTAKSILWRIYGRRGSYVPYSEFHELVKTGKNPEAIRQHVKLIRDSLEEVGESPDHVVVIRMKGVQWQDLSNR
ncbi:response regulator transcription factor [Pseudomonas kurunegalensis]|uniref:response regulator transcription factor n=1 Tax=Pseudomonas kurunegalensis TaxID=485880 RepID=UPI0025709629|nr:response regulator [Pseudomonas kurunegalensis]WJD61544.1 response regulator [Pseudomonas kurunegalensis]